MGTVKQKLNMIATETAEAEAERILEDPDALTGCADDLIPKNSVAVIKRILLEAENQRLRDALRKASDGFDLIRQLMIIEEGLECEEGPECECVQGEAESNKAICDAALAD